jgi:hypothetical protein
MHRVCTPTQSGESCSSSHGWTFFRAKVCSIHLEDERAITPLQFARSMEYSGWQFISR